MYTEYEDQVNLQRIELQYKLDEAQSELKRHHVAFARISLFAAEAETLLARLKFGVMQNPEDIMDLQSAIRTIRNTVG